MSLSGSSPVLLIEQMEQVIEPMGPILLCPPTKFLLRFTDIHGDAPTFAFGYIAPKRLQAVALPPVRDFLAL